MAMGKIIDNSGVVAATGVGNRKSATSVISRLFGIENEEPVDINTLQLNMEESDYSLVLEGDFLVSVAKDSELFQMFMIILFCSRAVIGYGFYPRQSK
jgi:hypothetical protein